MKHIIRTYHAKDLKLKFQNDQNIGEGEDDKQVIQLMWPYKGFSLNLVV